MPPLITVVMPAYNAASTIAAAVSSVLWQTWRNVEVVVVDDGSTDSTAEIVAALGNRVSVVKQQENLGVGAARKRGVEEAHGDLIAFCDADDLLFERHLEALVDVWERGGRGIATANAWWLLPGGITRGNSRHAGRFPAPDRQRMAILQQNFVSTMSLFPRSLVRQIGPFDESLRLAEDWDFWIRAIFAGYRVVHQPRPLALYRWSVLGLSSRREEFYRAEHAQLRRVAQRADLTDKERDFVARRLCSPAPRQLMAMGDDSVQRGKYHKAAQLYGQAASLCPSDRMLARNSRLLRLAPSVFGPILRTRRDARKKDLCITDASCRSGI